MWHRSEFDGGGRVAKLHEELSAWHAREIGTIRHLILDARYEKVRHGGCAVDCAALITKGARADDDKRCIRGVSVPACEAGACWRSYLESLQERGGHGVKTVTSDAPRVATLFPNEKAVLRRVSALLMEISEEWETGSTYIANQDVD